MTTYPFVLFVDADASGRALACELRRMDLEVRSTASVEEAIERAADWKPDVVLLALPCGVTGGVNVLNAIAARAPQAEVIVLTDTGTIDIALEAMRARAFDYVRRPWRVEEVEIRIRRALAWKALQTRMRELERVATPPGPGGIPTLRDTEREQIQRALGATGGRRAHAARLLGISERNLYRKIHTYHLEGENGRGVS